MIPDLFSKELPREPSSLPPNPPTPIADNAASTPRHVLPSDLPTAIKHLNDQELELLLAAVTVEQQRRGKNLAAPDKAPSKRVEAQSVFLTPGKLNAVRAAFKAGVSISKIGKQFGIPTWIKASLISAKQCSALRWRCDEANVHRQSQLRRYRAQMPFRILMPFYEFNEVQFTCLEANLIQFTAKQLIP
jgi:hypothetical protein